MLYSPNVLEAKDGIEDNPAARMLQVARVPRHAGNAAKRVLRATTWSRRDRMTRIRSRAESAPAPKAGASAGTAKSRASGSVAAPRA